MSSDHKEMDAKYLVEMLLKNKMSNQKFNPAYCGAKCISHFKELFRKQNVDIDIEKEFGEHVIKAKPRFK
jgi:hypothetical protein